MIRRSPRRRLGRVFRLGRGATRTVALRRGGALRARRAPPPVLIVFALAGLIAAGTLLLMLPPAAADGTRTSLLTAFFTATSAACTTGLVVVDTADHWSLFGQIVILLLFQIGGIGFLTSSTLILLVLGRRLGLRDRLLVQEAMGEGTLGGVPALVRRIVRFALVTEAIGAVILTAYFWSREAPPRALWFGVFHSVSAFTNASFDLMGGFRSFSEQGEEPVLLLTIAGLIIAGGISYSVVADCRRTRRFRMLTLDSKLVLVTTGVLLVGGMAGFYLLERENQATLAPLDLPAALLQSFFFSAASRSSGFQPLNPGAFTEATLLFLVGLMFIGGAAGSTAGGIKVNSLGVLAAAVLSAVKGRARVVAFWREIPTRVVMRALTVATLAFLLIFCASLLVTVTASLRYLPLLFEVTSAFGTVGLTTGITPSLAVDDKLVLIFMMFVGRLGPLTLAVALTQQQEDEAVRHADAGVRIG